MTSKTCTGCRETKELNAYHRNKSRSDGRSHRCKSCVKAYQAEWRERPEVQAHKAEWTTEYESRPEVKEHRAKYRARPEVKARQAEYEARAETKARRSEYRVDYYKAHREDLLAKAAEYNARPEVKARRAEYGRAYNRANRARIGAYNAEYHRANREAILSRKAAYAADSPHAIWEANYRRRSKGQGFTPAVESFTREELIDRWGPNCVHCGGPFESLDHYPQPINRGGAHSLDNCRPSCNTCQAHSWRPGFTATHTSIKENN